MGPAVVGVIVLGTWLFAPSPKEIFRGDEPDISVEQTEAIADANYAQINFDNAWKQYDEVSKKLTELQEKVDEQQRQKDESKNKIVSYAQDSNEMAMLSLMLIPEEHITPESEQAKIFVQKTDFALSSIVGELSTEKREKLSKLVAGLLSQIQSERDNAKKELEEKDKILNQSIIDLKVANARLEDTQTALVVQEEIVAEKREEVEKTKTEYESKVQEAFSKIQEINGKLGFWQKFLFVLAGIYILFFWVLPLLSEEFVWLRPVVRLLKWVRNIVFRV